MAVSRTQAEQCLLGCLMVEPALFDEVGLKISSADFVDLDFAALFNVMRSRYENGMPVRDPVLLLEDCRKLNVKLGPADIAKIFQSVTNECHAIYYAEIIAEASRVVNISLLHSELGSHLNHKNVTSTALVDLLEARLKTIDMSTPIVIDSPADAIAKFEESNDSNHLAHSGIPVFDQNYGGFANSEMTVLAGRTGSGKTILAWQFLIESCKANQPCMIASLEMTTKQLMDRHFASATGIAPIAFRKRDFSPGQLERIEQEKDVFREYPISIFASYGATVRQISAAARLKKSRDGLSLLVVDYIQLISASKSKFNRREELIAISGELRELAKDLDIPVIVLAQLNRQADGVTPKVSHIAESDKIGHDADTVLLINRQKEKTSLIVDKHRYVEDSSELELAFSNGKLTGHAPVESHPNYHSEFSDFQSNGVY